jgi:hypothetical protein
MEQNTIYRKYKESAHMYLIDHLRVHLVLLTPVQTAYDKDATAVLIVYGVQKHEKYLHAARHLVLIAGCPSVT